MISSIIPTSHWKEVAVGRFLQLYSETEPPFPHYLIIHECELPKPLRIIHYDESVPYSVDPYRFNVIVDGDYKILKSNLKTYTNKVQELFSDLGANEPAFSVTVIKSVDLDQPTKDSIFELVELNEIFAKDMRYIIIRMSDPSLPRIIGFVAFDFSFEETDDDYMIPVLYCYEIQVSSEYQGIGIGERLLKSMKLVAKDFQMKKVMLTCFTTNTSAIKFYKRHRFISDEISPEFFDPDTEHGYMIMSVNI
ncbi:hypothetical protein BB560_002227 [Smittium megazygosporum]|uniref:N-alpha-acetyltransferase 40 n=1 Tax=Smittium megazygosporum TaxID=133381 RepID=A0A2T9ZFC8_9FUNG|nr:hypothetical protein BB560_002226 [Smittium megazygosporum]PVV03304.1 hypothetical protein BB560_002227 [Smittium megazygosporum]